MTKVINYLMAAAVSMTSVSAIAASTCGNFSGFYAGVTGGYGMGHSKVGVESGKYTGQTTSTDGTTTPGTNTPGATSINSLGLKGFGGGVFFGYGKLFPNKVYLGFEANAAFNRVRNNVLISPASTPTQATANNGVTTTTQTQDNKSYSAERREAFGGALRIGGIMGAGMLTYAKFGVESAKFRLGVNDGDTTTTSTTASTDKSVAATGPTTTGTLFPGSNSKRLTGIVFGLGMETMISEHVSLGGEYTFTTYTGSMNATNVPATTATNSQDTTSVSVARPKTSDFRLRIAYKW